MNDLLAKPYLPEQLFATIRRWCGGHAAATVEEGEAVPAGTPVVVRDADAALWVVGGDPDAARLMLAAFLRVLPEQEAALRAAHARGDLDALFQVVHKLAGSAPIVGATAIHARARLLQDLLRHASIDASGVDAAVAALLHELFRFGEQEAVLVPMRVALARDATLSLFSVGSGADVQFQAFQKVPCVFLSGQFAFCP
jgi:HPt (histidine-containing phosphotransfer) domain-containing protein